jgi:hypothetical protein
MVLYSLRTLQKDESGKRQSWERNFAGSDSLVQFYISVKRIRVSTTF